MPELHDPTIEREADVMRRQIAERAPGRVRALSRFAARFAADEGLRDEAALLGLRAPHEAGDLDARLLDLLDRIVEDNVAAGGAGAGVERQRRYERVRQQLERARPAEDRAFVGVGLSKRYGDKGFCLEPLDLSLKLGEITGVVGQNAQGKTTLLRIVAGELEAGAGSLSYPALGQSGPDIDWHRLKQQVAFVPQELPRWRGGLADTLHFEAAMRGVAPADNTRDVRFVVERLDLGAHLDKRWDDLSGGYRLRFSLARALVWKPRLLVLDEPLANLDPMAREVLLKDLSQLARAYRHPIAVLMSSHDLQGLERVCAQMIFLKQGRVHYIGRPDGVPMPGGTHMFELTTPWPASRLQAVLADAGLVDLRDAGGQYVLTTSHALDAGAFLSLVLQHGAPVQHFRDISRSVRRLFD